MELGLNRLRMLRAVARYNSVTAAAEALHYTPSAISQQLSALETEIGAPVLERIGRRIRLTRVGHVLVKHANLLLTAEQQARTEVEQVRQSRAAELSIGVFATVAAGLLPAVLTELADQHPQLHLKSREVDPEDAVTDLQHGHLDLAFLLDYPDAPQTWPANLQILPLIYDHLHLAAPAGQFNTAEEVNLADLANFEWIISSPHTPYGRAVQTACQRAGIDLNITHQVEEQATALAMVNAGLGITLLSDLGHQAFQTRNVDMLNLTTPVIRQVLLAHHHALTNRPALQTVIASITRQASAIEDA